MALLGAGAGRFGTVGQTRFSAPERRSPPAGAGLPPAGSRCRAERRTAAQRASTCAPPGVGCVCGAADPLRDRPDAGTRFHPKLIALPRAAPVAPLLPLQAPAHHSPPGRGAVGQRQTRCSMGARGCRQQRSREQCPAAACDGMDGAGARCRSPAWEQH